ncbi:MAG: dihydropteroate synthase [Candidatus Krumholzibacteria bacterium]|nr:dihydropteroate synthase [Candidatus Krumholzibacteria bacterium]
MHYPLRLIASRQPRSLARTLTEAGVDPQGIEILWRKADVIVLRVDHVPAPVANIVKQQLLSIGGDAAVHRDVITGGPSRSSVYIIGDRNRLSQLPAKLARQPFGLAELGAGIERMIATIERPPIFVPLPHGPGLDLSAGPVAMGVLNVTPDSFSDGGAYLDPGAAYERAIAMVEEGAGIIDIGGESTRPGAVGVSSETEFNRVMPALRRIASSIAVPISIDTQKATVARAAIEAGASIINDVSGLQHDPAMIGTARETRAAVVVMHMQGRPETMQSDPWYNDATGEIISWFEERLAELASGGVDRDKIIVDPGLGFGKRLEDNLKILNEIGDLQGLGLPLMIGHSRKSFIGNATGRGSDERLAGGFAALAKCLAGGVRIVRVHDVRETVDFLRVWRAIENAGTKA